MTTETTHPDRLRIAARVADLRTRAGMTQAELAEKAGLPRTHILRIEHGAYNVTLEVLSKIARAFNMRVDFI